MILMTIMIMKVILTMLIVTVITFILIMWSIAGLVSEASNQELIRGETCPRLFSVLLFGNMIARDEK